MQHVGHNGNGSEGNGSTGNNGSIGNDSANQHPLPLSSAATTSSIPSSVQSGPSLSHEQVNQMNATGR